MAKRTEYPIHPDFKRWSKMNPPLNKYMLPVIQKLMKPLFNMEKSTDKLKVEKLDIPIENNDKIEALLYSPRDIEENAPCLIYFHGGGFVLPAAPYHFSLAREYAERAKCKVLFVDYRLAPKYSFPVAPEDSYSAYIWLLENAEKLGIDKNRIAVAGDSAGGQLATVVSLMARDREKPLPIGQMLIYPAAGNVETESMREFTDTPMCNSKDIEKYGKFYRPDPTVGENTYASPIEAESLKNLPKSYIETAEFDCLRDGGILYAKRLEESGVPTELYNTKGTIHGYDIVLDSPIVRESVDRRIAFLNKIFNSKEKS